MHVSVGGWHEHDRLFWSPEEIASGCSSPVGCLFAFAPPELRRDSLRLARPAVAARGVSAYVKSLHMGNTFCSPSWPVQGRPDDETEQIRVMTWRHRLLEHARPHAKRWKRYEKPQPGHRLHPTAVSGASHPDRQWRRVSVGLPLARGEPGHPPRLHSAPDTAPERQGRALTPRR
jgi:hypothetical protein